MPEAQRRILRWTVEVDDQDHDLEAQGPILAVEATHDARAVQFWTVEDLHPEWPDARADVPLRTFRVVGTGQLIPAGYTWVGSAPRHASGLVWHLLQRGGDNNVRRVEVKLDLGGGQGGRDQIMDALREAVRRRGGDVQVALGARPARKVEPSER